MHFDRFGLSFDYPENWSVDHAQADETEVTVYSPEGAFWSVSVHTADENPATLAAEALGQMRSEYQDLDSETACDVIDGRTLPGLDLNFCCLDLTNTAAIRTLAAPGAIYLFFCQAEDREWDRVSHVFAAMTASFIRCSGAARGSA